MNEDIEKNSNLDVNVINNALTPTLAILAQRYPPLVNQNQLAEIFQRSVIRIRVFLQNGRLPLQKLSFSDFHQGQSLYRLTDIANFIDGKLNSSHLEVETKKVKKNGRPVGSRNKPKILADAEEIPSMTMSI